jgi:hypothetical protein
MILTALGVILTVGLGDDDQNDLNNPHRVSAYSVFNRGFHRLMGSIDVENLVNQHVGGGMLGVAGATAAAAAGGADMDAGSGRTLQDRRMERLDPHDPSRTLRRRRDTPAAAAASVNASSTQLQEQTADRRRDLEQRLELQRQRRIAMERGLAEG